MRDLSFYRLGLSLFVIHDIVLRFLCIVLGLDAFEKKEGIPQNRNLNEKVTDGARGLFEKATGFVFLNSLSHPPPPVAPIYPPLFIAHTSVLYHGDDMDANDETFFGIFSKDVPDKFSN